MVGNVIDVIVYVKIIIGHVSIICSMSWEVFRPYIAFSPDGGGNEGGDEFGILSDAIKSYWERFDDLRWGDLFLEKPGGGNGLRLEVPKGEWREDGGARWQANGSGLWFEVEGGVWLVPWGLVIGKKGFDEYGEKVVKRRDWNSVEERLGSFLKLAGKISLPDKGLEAKPPKGSVYDEGTVFKLNGNLTGGERLKYGKVYWLTFKRFESGGLSLKKIRSDGALLLVGNGEGRNEKHGRRKRW